MKRLDTSGGASTRARTTGDAIVPPPLAGIETELDLDLTGVDPLRRTEVRRRVAVIRSFIATPEPTDEDRLRHAGALSVSDNQFKALVRAWRSQPVASKVAGSGRSRGTPRASGPRHLDPRVKLATEAAIINLNPNANLGEAVQAVSAACAAIGLEAPKKSTVHKMLTAARQSRISPQDAGIVVVGQVRVRLPVIEEDGIALPLLTLAVRADDGVVVAATMNTVEAAFRGVVAVASGVADLKHLQVDYGIVPQLPSGNSFIGTMLPGVEIRRHLCRVMGNEIGGVRIIFRTGGDARPERFLRANMDRPLSPADALSVVIAAIDSSNAARGGPPVVRID